MRIFKYKLEITDEQQIEMPKDAIILSCQQQHSFLMLWAIVEPESENVKRTFEIVGTGNEMQVRERNYISTVNMGAFVWHIFEISTP